MMKETDFTKMQLKHNIQSMPIQKDEAQVVQGHYKGQPTGKAVRVHRKKYVIYTKRMQREVCWHNCPRGHSPQQGGHH
ncbi:60S ribosomal protein L26 [Camelus dromedarius]|uniref:60S ribosomal protein L26 n=1 Tax=Camelus dromedarius TaxID=9838 RepID=A0A5N4D733_CAMDR|nr:60S ribosomal protein L26 [Camelus dromedarius]